MVYGLQHLMFLALARIMDHLPLHLLTTREYVDVARSHPLR
jgi:hypothetical protein